MSKTAIDALIEDLSAGRISRREFVHRAMFLGASGASLGLGLRGSARAADGILVGFSFPSFEHFRWRTTEAILRPAPTSSG